MKRKLTYLVNVLRSLVVWREPEDLLEMGEGLVHVVFVVETEATDVDGVSVEVVKLEDGVGGLLGLGISDQVKQD